MLLIHYISFSLVMDQCSNVRFIVIDGRCDSGALLPCCEEFFHSLPVQLTHFFNLLVASEAQHSSTIVSIILVKDHKVEVCSLQTYEDETHYLGSHEANKARPRENLCCRGKHSFSGSFGFP